MPVQSDPISSLINIFFKRKETPQKAVSPSGNDGYLESNGIGSDLGRNTVHDALENFPKTTEKVFNQLDERVFEKLPNLSDHQLHKAFENFGRNTASETVKELTISAEKVSTKLERSVFYGSLMITVSVATVITALGVKHSIDRKEKREQDALAEFRGLLEGECPSSEENTLKIIEMLRTPDINDAARKKYENFLKCNGIKQKAKD